LHQFEEKLPPDASMEHINIKTQKDDDWFTPNLVLTLALFMPSSCSFGNSIFGYSLPT
jgi:hypothetical protein